MKEFFGFCGGELPYGRPADGAWSLPHILMVSIFLVIGISLAIFLGIVNRTKDNKTKNIVLIVAAILIDLFEIAKIIIGCVGNPNFWRISLPLFLCSIQLITIPLAAFTNGRLKEAALDFVVIFGMMGGILGTVGATQNYNAYPAFSWPNFVSAMTHTISAFAALYIIISGMASMRKRNIVITFAILFTFCIAAYVANIILDYNYMFLMYHDGTPYQMFYDLVGGNPVLYPMIVILLFVLLIIIFYFVFDLVARIKLKNESKNQFE